MIKAVIFDFDGTLADTLPIVYQGFQHIFRTYRNEEFTEEHIKGLFGPAEADIIQKNFPADQVASGIEDFHHYYEKNHQAWVKRSQAVEDLLYFIKDQNLHLGVVTGKGRKTLDLSMEALGMTDLFDMTVAGDEVTKPKPEPEGILKVLDVFDTPPEQAIYAGDSDDDIRAGKAAGVETAGIHWLPNYQTSHFSTNPDHVFTKADDFKAYLQKKI